MSEILQLAEAISRLLRADNILLLCHKNPDGDTVGSAMALCHVLKSLGIIDKPGQTSSHSVCGPHPFALCVYAALPV